MTGIHLNLRQGTPEWLAARRELITGTDIPVILGISPYRRSEADLADEKLGRTAPAESTIQMRVGSALEELILAEYEAVTGCRAVRYRAMVRAAHVPWAAASPDARRVGERRLVELKWTTTRRWEDGLPPDVEAQVQWQLGCVGYPVADVAVLTPSGLLPPFEVRADSAVFEDLLVSAADFRARLAAGGPFAHGAESVARAYPRDNGAELVADAEIAGVVRQLLDIKARRKALEEDQDRLETAIKARIGECSALSGPGFRVTWRRSKDTESVDWRKVAEAALGRMPEPERAALVGLYTTEQQGRRYLRVVSDKEV